jgi:hypothetical protein
MGLCASKTVHPDIMSLQRGDETRNVSQNTPVEYDVDILTESLLKGIIEEYNTFLQELFLNDADIFVLTESVFTKVNYYRSNFCTVYNDAVSKDINQNMLHIYKNYFSDVNKIFTLNIRRLHSESKLEIEASICHLDMVRKLIRANTGLLPV